MNHHPGGFHNHQQGFILVKDLQVTRFGLQGRRSRFRDGDAEPVAIAQFRGGLGALAVQQDGADIDQAVDPGAR